MRSHLLARRIAAPALGLALALTMAACSSSGSSTTASPSSAPPSSAPASSPAAASSPTAGSTAASGNATALVTANWESFFDGKTSAAKKISLLENGQTALGNQTGTAVYQDGMWKVGDVSFCQLLKIENGGTAPSVCS